MSKIPHITEAEWLIMRQLWEESPLTAADIVQRVQSEKRLEPTTIKTLLRRLIAKGAANFSVDEKNTKIYWYFPLVNEEECVTDKSRHFLSLYYKNDVEKLFATFVDSETLSDTEIQSLQNLLERKKDNPDA